MLFIIFSRWRTDSQSIWPINKLMDSKNSIAFKNDGGTGGKISTFPRLLLLIIMVSLSLCRSIYPWVALSISVLFYLWLCCSIHPAVLSMPQLFDLCCAIYTSVVLSIPESFYLYLCCSIYVSAVLSIFMLFYLSCSSIYAYIILSIPLSLILFLFVRLSFYLCVVLSVCLFVVLSFNFSRSG